MSFLTKDKFPEIKSEPNWWWTWSIRIVLVFLFCSIALLLFAFPLLLFIDGEINAGGLLAFAIVYYPVLIWLSYIALRYLRRIKGNAVKQITVNREGVHYEKIDGSVESVLYRQLQSSVNESLVYDVFVESRLVYAGSSYFTQRRLCVLMNGRKKTELFFHPDTGHSYFARNSRLLRGRFLQGISLFRPDLRISPSVYSEYSIHPETFEFDRKSYWQTMLIATIFVILVFVVIEWYMEYRFGSSLFF